jgi:hypothetical protein
VAFQKTGALDTMPNVRDDSHQPFYSPAMSINRIMHEYGHRFIYGFPTFAEMLKAAEFVDVRKRAFNEGAVRDLLMDTEGRKHESVYVEGRKPFTALVAQSALAFASELAGETR